MFGKLISRAIALPLDVARVPAKVVKAVDEATIDSGLSDTLEDLSEGTLGTASEGIKGMGDEFDRG